MWTQKVKRLLREDNDAVSVKWEIISEDDDQIKHDNPTGVSSTEEDPSLKTDANKNKANTVKSKTRPMVYLGTPKNATVTSDLHGNIESPDEGTPRLDLGIYILCRHSNKQNQTDQNLHILLYYLQSSLYQLLNFFQYTVILLPKVSYMNNFKS